MGLYVWVTRWAGFSLSRIMGSFKVVNNRLYGKQISNRFTFILIYRLIVPIICIFEQSHSVLINYTFVGGVFKLNLLIAMEKVTT